MNKALAVMIAGLFAAGAYAQNPPGAAAEQAPVTNTKSQARADAKVAAKPAGQVKTGAGGDINKTPEGGAIGTDKAAMAGEKRAETRDARRPAKNGGVKAKSMQGGTPK
jgi:hypothetical protein